MVIYFRYQIYTYLIIEYEICARVCEHNFRQYSLSINMKYAYRTEIYKIFHTGTFTTLTTISKLVLLCNYQYGKSLRIGMPWTKLYVSIKNVLFYKYHVVYKTWQIDVVRERYQNNLMHVLFSLFLHGSIWFIY